jgi:hypothetical protein
MEKEDRRLPDDARRRVFAALVRHPFGLTRQALASAADVPTTTLAAMLQEGRLLGGLVIETKAKHAATGGGPKPKIVRLCDGICVAGVEIGHGHVRIGIAGLDGRLWADDEGNYFDQIVMPVFKERRRTLNWIAGSPENDRGALSRRLSRVFAARRGQSDGSSLERPFVLGVGVSVAGPVDPTDGRLVCVRPADGLILKEEEGSIACADWDGESAGQGLRDRLRNGDQTELFGWSMSHFRSDSASELCAKAELRDGVLSDTDFAVFIKWTGNVSAAVVLGGKVVVGSRGLAGGFPLHSSLGVQEEGINELGSSPKRLPLGIAVGIRRLGEEISNQLNLRGRDRGELLRDYFRDEILSVARGEKMGAEQMAVANGYLRRAATLLGENLAPTVDMLDPSNVVIGGGVFEKRDWPIVAESLFEGIRANVTVPSKTPKVELARYQEHPALKGAIASRLGVRDVVSTLVRACDEHPMSSTTPPSATVELSTIR